MTVRESLTIKYMAYNDNSRLFEGVRNRKSPSDFKILDYNIDQHGSVLIRVNGEYMAMSFDDVFRISTGERLVPQKLSRSARKTLFLEYEHVPSELTNYKQWIGIMPFRPPKNPEVRLPVRCDSKTLALADPKNPATWTSFREAVEAKERFGFQAVAYVLTENDPYVLVNITYTTEPASYRFVSPIIRLMNSYTELEGDGSVQILIKAKLQAERRISENLKLYDRHFWIELYGPEYSAIGPQKIEYRQKELNKLLSFYSPIDLDEFMETK